MTMTAAFALSSKLYGLDRDACASYQWDQQLYVVDKAAGVMAAGFSGGLGVPTVMEQRPESCSCGRRSKMALA